MSLSLSKLMKKVMLWRFDYGMSFDNRQPAYFLINSQGSRALPKTVVFEQGNLRRNKTEV